MTAQVDSQSTNVASAREPDEQEFRRHLDNMPTATYACDAEGLITYFNRRAVELWGREPKLRDAVDRYCGSFRLFASDGTPIRHDECWSALALRDERAYEGQEILVERPDGSLRLALAHASPVHDDRGRLVGAVNMLVDVTEQKQAEKQLRRGEQRLADFFENAAMPIHWVGPDGIILKANRAELKLLGYCAEEFIGHHVAEFHADRNVIDEILQRLRRGEELRDRAVRLRCKDGSIRHVLITSNGLWENGHFVHSRCLTRDVTDRKAAEDALRVSEQRFSGFMQQFPGLAWIKDLQGRYVYANAAAAKVFRFPQSELYGKTDDEVFPPETAEQFRRNDRQALERGVGIQTVEVLEHDDGILHHSFVSKFPIFGPDGKPMLVGGMAIDITERMRIEETLREREERYELVMAGAEAAIWDWDVPRGRVLFSPRWKELRGLSDDEVSDREEEWSSRIHPHDVDRVMAAVRAHFDGHTAVFSEEYRVRHNDGHWVWIHDRGIARRDEKGHVVRMAGSATDITARKQAEDALQRRAEELQTLVDTLPIGVFFAHDPECRRVTGNRASHELLRVTFESNLSKTAPMGEQPTHFRVLQNGVEVASDQLPVQRAARGETVRNQEVRHVFDDGTAFDLLVSAAPLRDHQGEPRGAVASVLDITERKLAESALRASENRKSAILAAALDAVITMDHRGFVVDCNPAVETVFGYGRDELCDRPLAELLVPERLRQRHYEGLARYLATGEGPVLGKLIEMPALHADGHEFAVELSITRVADVDPPLFTATLRDISQRKRAERILRESEERLRLAMEAGRMGTWEWSLETNDVYWSASLEEIHGLAPGTFPGTFEAFQNDVHPADRERVARSITSALHGSHEHHVEYRIVWPDGSLRWVEGRGKVVRNEAGDPVRMIGVCADITERKRADEALRESEQRFRLMADAAPVLIWVSDADKRGVYFNERWLEFTGRLLEQEIGHGWLEGVHPDDRQRVDVACRQAFDRRESFRMEFRLRRADGEYRWVLDHGVPRFTAEGQFEGYIGSCVDMTERRIAEEALQESEERYRRLVGLLPVAVYTCEAPSGVITFYNEHASLLWGRAPEQGDTDQRFCGSFRLWRPNGSRLPHDWTPMAVAIREGRSFRNEEVIIERPDGSRIHVLVNIDPIRDARGRVVGAINAFHDVSALKRAQEAQAQLAAIVEASEDAIISKSLDGIIQTWNAGAERLYGYTAAEAIGQSIDLAVPPELCEQERTILQRLCQGERIASLETVRLSRERGRFDVSLTISPIVDEAGRIVGASSVARDISDRKRAEAALKAKEAELELVAETTPLILSRCSRDLRYLFTNRASAALFGLTPDEMVGRPIVEIVGERAFAIIQPRIEQVLRGEQVEYEAEIPYNVAGPRWVRVTYTPEQDDTGDVVGWVASIVDITERKQAEEALRESETRYRAVVESQSEMLCRFHRDGTILFVNGAYARAQGTTSEALLGRNFWNFIPQANRSAVKAMLDRLSPSEPEVCIENRFQTVDGERWTLWTNRALKFDAEGRFVEAQSSGIDITDRKRGETELAVLAATGRELASSLDYEQALASLARAVVPDFAQWCAVDLLDDEGNLKRLAETQLDPPADSRLCQNLEAYYPNRSAKRGVWSVMRTGMAEISNDESDDPARPCTREDERRKRSGDRAFASRICVPLVAHHTTFGAITFATAASRRQYDLRDLEVARDIARCAALVIESARLYRNLRDSEERLSAILQQLPVGVALMDLDGQVVTSNEVMRGFMPISIPSRDPERVDRWRSFQPDGGLLEPNLWPGARALRGETVAPGVEFLFRTDAGTEIWTRLAASPFRDATGKIIGAVAVVEDIDQLKRAQEALRDADRRKDEFLATLAHELRNPLAPIRAGLEVMKLAGSDPATVETARCTMQRQTQQLIALVDDLLDVSRITLGKLELRMCRVAAADIVQSAVEASQPIIDEAGQELCVMLPAYPLDLHADPHRLEQVLANLLNNAAKYTPEGGHIWLSAQQERNDVVFSVKDTGLGISVEMQDRIFELFTQVDRPLEKGYQGLGIGLTLAKSLVEMHGGSISVRSAGLNQGTEFRVRLPVVAGASPVEPMPDVSHANNPAGRLRILVVDDNKAAANMLSIVIKMLGNEVRTAGDGQEAIEVAAQFRPDLILMDLGMPKMNGYEAARRIREQRWGRKMKLVALTGWSQHEYVRRTKEAGFDDHLVKPVEPACLENLFSKIRRKPK